MDSRTASILIKPNLGVLCSGVISSQYGTLKQKMAESEKGDRIKSYDSLRSTIKECYLTGSLKYGNNFIM